MSLRPFAAGRYLLPAAASAAMTVLAVAYSPADGPRQTLAWEPGPGNGAMILVLKGVTEDESNDLKVVFVRKSDGQSLDLPGNRSYDAGRRTLTFTPRFPLDPDVTYLGIFEYNRPGEVGQLVANFRRARPARKVTRLTGVSPSADVLPENQLKFYLEFSAPMARGEAYKAVKILDDKGKAIELPFLEIGEELWDPTGTRLTLLLDPGRIKRGLKPREEDGPIFEEGKSYTLVVDANWPDESGEPLSRPTQKRFKIGPPDDTQPTLASWKTEAPKSGTGEPLRLRFPEPLDRAMLQNAIRVTGPDGKDVEGRVKVEDGETTWHFTPNSPWIAGKYTLMIDSELEDLAGNSLRRTFEIDVLRPTPRSGRDEDATMLKLAVEIQ